MFHILPWWYCDLWKIGADIARSPPCLDGNTDGLSASCAARRFAKVPIDVRRPMQRMWIPMDSTMLEHPLQDGTGEAGWRYFRCSRECIFLCTSFVYLWVSCSSRYACHVILVTIGCVHLANGSWARASGQSKLEPAHGSSLSSLLTEVASNRTGWYTSNYCGNQQSMHNRVRLKGLR
jgi:hypothetical protein